jgi:hypothetical protein
LVGYFDRSPVRTDFSAQVAGEAGASPRSPPRSREVVISFPQAGQDAGISGVWIRDARRRVVLKLPIGMPKWR